MYRAIPEGNRLVSKRCRENERRVHKQKIADARAFTDTREPQVYSMNHLRVNMKREQMLEERYSEIDRHNQILLQKMTEIIRQPTSTGLPEIRGPASLNKDRRRKDLVRITQENQSILRRIQEAQPVYNHIKWEESYRQSERYLRTACEYPVILSARRRRPQGRIAPLDTDRLEVKDKLQDPQKDTGPMSARTHGAGPEPVQSVFGVQFVHKESIPIGRQHYLVEIGTDGRALTITAYDGATNSTLELLINEKAHRRLYREAGGNYGSIARRLTIENGKLAVAGLLDGHHEAVQDAILDADAMVKPLESLADAAAGLPRDSTETGVGL